MFLLFATLVTERTCCTYQVDEMRVCNQRTPESHILKRKQQKQYIDIVNYVDKYLDSQTQSDSYIFLETVLKESPSVRGLHIFELSYSRDPNFFF